MYVWLWMKGELGGLLNIVPAPTTLDNSFVASRNSSATIEQAINDACLLLEFSSLIEVSVEWRAAVSANFPAAKAARPASKV
jgi:hypothetical protein